MPLILYACIETVEFIFAFVFDEFDVFVFVLMNSFSVASRIDQNAFWFKKNVDISFTRKADM